MKGPVKCRPFVVGGCTMAKSAKKNQRMKQPEILEVERINKSKSNFKNVKASPNTSKPKKEKKPKKKKQPQAIYDNPYKLSHIYRQVAWQLNKAYDEVRNEGYTSNNIRLFEQTLEGFYDKYGLKVANKHHISIQKYMSMEAVEELAKITLHFADIATVDRAFFLEDITKGLSPKDISIIQNKQQEAIVNGDDEMDIDGIKMPWDKFDVDKFNQIQDLYGVKTVQDFIDWTDDMERFRSEAFLQTVLNSHQIADVFAYAIDAQKANSNVNLDFEALNRMAYRIHMKNGGIKGSALRKAIYERISDIKG